MDHVTEETEGLIDPQPEAEVAVLVEEEPEKSPGTEPQDAPGDGTAGKDPEKENLKTALREGRSRAKARERNLLAEIEVERTGRRQAEERAARAESEKGSKQALEKLDDATLSEAAPTIVEMAVSSMAPQVVKATRIAIRATQAVARLQHQDYDEVVEKYLVPLIKLDPVTKRPADPEMWDKVYVNPIDDDSGETAYQLATELKERAEGTGTIREAGVTDLSEKAGDRAQGRRDVIETLTETAARPRGIRAIPASPAPAVRTLTRAQIDAMTPEQRGKLSQSVIDQWLGAPPG